MTGSVLTGKDGEVGMKIARVLELLRCERECVSRNGNGCDRRCGRCDLVQEDHELIEMYDFLISMMELKREE